MAKRRSLVNKPNTTVGNVQMPTPGMPSIPSDTNGILVAQQQYRSAPLPDPEELIRYNDAVPDAANRIITMAENQSAHRQSLEKSVVDAQNRNSFWGIIIGAFLSLVIVLAGVYCILSGHDWAGAILVSVEIVGLCAVFVYGTKINKKN